MLSIRDKLRSRNIDRWHIVATSQLQNVAEHSHCVGIIAEALLENLHKINNSKPTLEERYIVLKYAQVHDLPEICLGDSPSTTGEYLKRVVPQLRETLAKIERQLCPEIAELENRMTEAYPYLKHVCKAADILEAYSFMHIAQGLDAQHNAVVFEKLSNAISNHVKKGQELYPLYHWGCIDELKDDIVHGQSAVIDFESKLTLDF